MHIQKMHFPTTTPREHMNIYVKESHCFYSWKTIMKSSDQVTSQPEVPRFVKRQTNLVAHNLVRISRFC